MLIKPLVTIGTMWVCGEVLVDRLSSPTVVNEGKDERINVVGGGAANTAKCISRLGYDVQFINGLSKDYYGIVAKIELLNGDVGLNLCLRDSKNLPA